MTSPVVTAREDDEVTTLVVRMIDRGLKRIPVVRDGAPIGLVARHDLLKMIAGERWQHAKGKPRG